MNKYILSRQNDKDDEFYPWGTYDIDDPLEVRSMMYAVFDLAKGIAINIKMTKENAVQNPPTGE